MTHSTKNRYMLIDGNALIHRGFHAIPGLTTKSGEPTGAVYGFTMILLRAIKDLKPTHIACTFDLAGPTFRHVQYEEYKAHRVKSPQELYDQIPRVKEIVRLLNIPIFELEGFEADDCLGTLSAAICNKDDNAEVLIVTGDLDTLQLVNDCVKIYTLRKGLSDVAIYDEVAILQRYGLTPQQMIDFKALRGDPSDNIKGVKGIGEKGAIDLIKEFGSIDALYKAVHENITGGVKAKTVELLRAQEQSARLSYKLSRIVTNVPITVDVPRYSFSPDNLNKIIDLFKQLEFKTLVDKLPKVGEELGVRKLGGREEAEEKELVATPELGAPAESVVPVKTPSSSPQNYVLIDTQEEAEKLAKRIELASAVVLDTETTGLDVFSAELVGVSVSIQAGEAYYIPAKIFLSSTLKTAIEKHERVVGHNTKFDFLILQETGVILARPWFDTMIASYLLNAGTRQHGLDTLAFNELGYQMQPIEDLIGKGKNQITMDQVPVERVSWYASEDADITYQLFERFAPELTKEGLIEIFEDIEMPLIEVLANMERTGIGLDVKRLKRLETEADKLIGELEKEIHKLTGVEFNINSPKQLKEVLFDTLGLVAVGGKKTKTGQSTAAGELEKMLGQHPVIEKILQYREVSKLQNTYITALSSLVNKKSGRIHTSYNQTIAATGRLSSTDPNLQNIPNSQTGLAPEIRKAFIPQKGWKLLSLDYSQIELRIVAHLSGDEAMQEVFKQNLDIHTKTAMEMFGVGEDSVSKDHRRAAKAINFGILYGLSAYGLSYGVEGLSQGDARDYIEKYFAAYPGVKAYLEKVKAEVRATGMVRNELGRIRKFPEIKSTQFFIRQAAERAAINFPVQSLAADVIKVAMINVFNELKYAKDINMLLQVHDELVLEVVPEKAKYYASLIQKLMEEAIVLSVPIKVEIKMGDNWCDMEKI